MSTMNTEDAESSKRRGIRWRIAFVVILLAVVVILALYSLGLVDLSVRSRESTAEVAQGGRRNGEPRKKWRSDPCADLAGWKDYYNDTCDWYEENEPVGCPNEGHVNGTNLLNGTNLVLASEACCHCHEGNTVRTGDVHGKWVEVHQESAQTREQFNPENMDINIEAIIGGSIGFIILCLCCLFIFCCCCV